MLIHTEVAGSGSPCVLLHGWGMHGGIWRETAQALSRDHQVISLDLPGHGRSETLPGEYALDTLTEAVAAILPPQGSIVGWSLGGMVALNLAARFPGRVRRLVLVAATPQFVAGEGWQDAIAAEVLEGFAARLREDRAATIRQFLALQVMGGTRERRLLAWLRSRLSDAPPPHPGALQGGLEILRRASLLPLLDQVDRPVTLIHGDRDTLIPWTAAKALHDRLPEARLHVIPGAAHAPFLSHPEEFLSIVGGALDGQQ